MSQLAKHNVTRRPSLQPPLKPLRGFPVLIGSLSSGLVERIVWDIYTLLIGLYLEGERVVPDQIQGSC